MRYPTSNIIAIRRRSATEAYSLFVEYIKKVESVINVEAKNNPTFYRELTPSALEVVSLDIMRKSCADTPFRSDEIKLISGSRFPDILAERYYGLEVKSTKLNHWATIGGSIVENTRIHNVNDIYLLFGNLGATPPIFKARPYQDCLYDVAVTHSPRYLINMDLKNGETIFNKMGVTYDEFRFSKDPISLIRHYYRKKAQIEQKGELPWWLNGQDNQSSIMIKSFKSLNYNDKERLIAEMLLLFNLEIINGDYDGVAVWLLTSQNIINSSLRDLFSSGGRLRRVKLNGQEYKFDIPLPAIVSRLVRAGSYIKNSSCNHQDAIALYNPVLLKTERIFENWVDQTEQGLREKYNSLKESSINLRLWIDCNAILAT